MKRSLVALKSQNIVTFLSQDLLGRTSLGVHGIKGVRLPSNGQKVQQCRKSGHFIGFVRNPNLSKNDTSFRGKGLDQMKGRALGRSGKRPTQGCPVNRNDIVPEIILSSSDQTEHSCLKPLGVNASEQVEKRIMTGDTMFQLKKRPEELFLFTAKDGLVGTSFTPTDDGHQTDDQHVMEIMFGCMTGTRAFNSLKKVGNSLHCSAS